MADQNSQRAPVLDTATRLAFERTRNSYENTMTSWIRTSTSLITFGFSIYKFFQIEAPNRPQQNHLIGPRDFALMLVSIGIFSLLLATLEHRQSIRAPVPQYTGKRHSLALLGRGVDFDSRHPCTTREDLATGLSRSRSPCFSRLTKRNPIWLSSAEPQFDGACTRSYRICCEADHKHRQLFEFRN
ncbi:MAG: DUF202 domain-containing protein [Candidatus Binataceae bacterium]|jgi:putative membrane protein